MSKLTPQQAKHDGFQSENLTDELELVTLHDDSLRQYGKRQLHPAHS